MNFLYLEARKGILRRYTLIALALFLCLNTVKIIADYHTGEIRRCGQYKRNAGRLRHHL